LVIAALSIATLAAKSALATVLCVVKVIAVSAILTIILAVLLVGFVESDFWFINAFWFSDDDCIGKWVVDTAEGLVWGFVFGKHNLHFDTHDTLFEENMSNRNVDEIVLGLTGTDHEPIFEFHGFGSLLAEFARNEDLASEGAISHNSLDDGLGSQSDWDFLKQFVFQLFNLGRSAETLLDDWLENDLDGIFLVAESLLEQRSQFIGSSAVFTSGLFGVGDTDHNFCLGRGDFDLNSCVTSRLQGSLEELVEFGVEDAVNDELSLFGDLLESGLGSVVFIAVHFLKDFLRKICVSKI